MAVFRIEKTRDYTVMSNHHLRNTALSLKAKGLLSLMLSLPEGWDYTTKGLARICKDGVDSICAGVRELEEQGYVIRERVRNANGQLGAIEYTILEQPRQPEPEREKPGRENPVQANPVLDNPVLGKPEQGNPAQLNTKESSNYGSITDLSNTELSNPIQSNPQPLMGQPPAGTGMGTDGMGVYGLLGANGAGKTTLMRMICDVQTETKGVIMLNGKNIHDLGEQYRNILGYLPQHFGYYPNFTAYKFLMYIAAIKGLPHQKAHKRSLELLEKVGLSEQKNVKIETFSGGMKQRLGIAQALLNNPKILILDEPTAGLDPKERVRFRNLISTLAENRIVILSTHIVSDVEYIAKEILIMKNGELLHQGSAETILQPIQSFVWECDVTRQEVDSLEKNYVVANLKHSAGAERLRIISEVAPCKTARNVEPTLEDLYLYYFAEVSDNE